MNSPLSLSQKVWKAPLHTPIKSLSDLQAILLREQGLKNHTEIEEFLNPTLSSIVSPWEMNDMKKAVQRIERAIEKQERIVVFGDFDTDGITATVVLVQALKELGALVSYRIPDRNTDSHGLKTHLLDELIQRNVALVITVDCGINDAKEVEHAAKQGLDIIITDHHEPDETSFPKKAIAVINPKVGENGTTHKNLSGSAVAWKLATALCAQKAPDLVNHLLEIAAIGIVADCVPLVGENRVLAKFGIEKIKQTQWAGLSLLLEETETSFEKISEETVGFVIAPHLNAASRVGDVLIAAQLFLGDEKENMPRIKKLREWNTTRRTLTEEAVSEARKQVREEAPFQILYGEKWSPGILGLIAARYSQQLGVPVIACTLRDDGKISASCRAPYPYSIIEGLRAVEHCFERFGGHDGAAGFLMERDKFEGLKTELDNHFCETNIGALPQTINAWISPELLSWELIDFLKFFAPFGAGNPAPILGIKNVQLKTIHTMGAQKNHMRFTGETNGLSLDFVAFFSGHFLPQIKVGDCVDIAITIGENEWNGERKLQLRVEDIRRSA